MNKYRIKFTIRFLTFLLSVLWFLPLFAQSEKAIPKDFFMGKWGGTIQYNVKLFDNKGRLTSHHTSSLQNINIVAEEFDDEDATSIETLKNLGFDNYTAEWMSKMRNRFNGNATYTTFSQFCDNKGMLSGTWELKKSTENIEISGHFFSNNRIWITGEGTVEMKEASSSGESLPLSGEYPTFSFGAAAWGTGSLEGIGFRIEDSKLVINYEGKPTEGGEEYDYMKITGELHRIYLKKDTLGKTVHINEPIKTDEFTQRDIVVPAVSEIPDFPYEIGKVYVFGNTDCIFTSENEMHLVSGEVVIFEDVNWSNIDMDKIVSSEPEISDIELREITTKLDKLREEGYDFKVKTPQAGCGVRGTQFITKVGKDGTTTLTVIDGEVEFSDKQKRKTVLVKKNQKSVVKPGGLPSDPVSIDPKQIPRWWE